MGRILSLLTMCMLCGFLVSAQDRVVSGKITDTNGDAVPFATIKVKGTRIITQAGSWGEYSIKVKTGDVLEILADNYKPVEVVIGSQQYLATTIEKTGFFTETLVTTAFGIKRFPRTVSANAQAVTGEQLNTIRQTNLNNALAGKVAGLQVRSQSTAKLDAQTSIRLRGESGLNGGTVVYVVDGTVLPNANDINTDDIEDITVMQGPAASALFGPQAQFGAVVITLKRARKNVKGMGIEVYTGVQFDNVYPLTKYQNLYAGGAAGDTVLKTYTWQQGQPDGWKALDGKFYTNYGANESWGPNIAGQEYIPWYAWFPGHEASFKTTALTAQPNNVTDFYNTAVTFNNTISFSKATDNSSVRFSYNNLTQQGLIPNTKLKRNIFNIIASLDLSTKLTAAANITYLTQNRYGCVDDNFGNPISGLFNSSFQRGLDMGIMKDLRSLSSPTGQLISWNHVGPTAYNDSTYLQANSWFNPYSYLDNVVEVNRRDRLYGDVSLTYKFNNNLKLRGAYRKQQSNTSSEYKYNKLLEISAATANNNKNAYSTTQTFSNRNIFEAVFSFNKKLNNFNINANAGFEARENIIKSFAANTVDGLKEADVFTLKNSVSPIDYTDTIQKEDGRAFFARGDIGFKNYFFAEFAIRKDYSSRLPAANASVLSKSFGASIIFSEWFKPSWLSFGKLRASFGEAPGILATSQYPGFNYTLANTNWVNSFGENIGTAISHQLIDPELTVSTTTTKEFGIDLRLFKNRLGVSVTYYDEAQKNLPVAVPINDTSGFASYLTNAGRVSKKGVDIQFNIKPVWTKNLQWDLNATWGKILSNKVISINKIEGDTAVQAIAQGYWENGTGGRDVAYTVQEEGQEWGQVYGTTIQQINGKRVIDNDPASPTYGRFLTAGRKSFGSVLPNFTGGVQNTFTLFKNFLININVDFQSGGKFYSLSESLMDNAGLSLQTAALNDKGIPVRDPVEAGGGVHVEGVDKNGNGVNLYVKASGYFKQNVVEDYIKDLTFVKLREFSIGYRIPVSSMKIGKWLQSATFSVVARNPWLIYAKAKNFDPSEISGVQGEDAQFPATRGVGINLKLGF